MRNIKKFADFSKINEDNQTDPNLVSKISNKLDDINDKNWKDIESINKKMERFIFNKYSENSTDGTMEYSDTFISFNKVKDGWGLEYYTGCIINGNKEGERSSKGFNKLSHFSKESLSNIINKLAEILRGN